MANKRARHLDPSEGFGAVPESPPAFSTNGTQSGKLDSHFKDPLGHPELDMLQWVRAHDSPNAQTAVLAAAAATIASAGTVDATAAEAIVAGGQPTAGQATEPCAQQTTSPKQPTVIEWPTFVPSHLQDLQVRVGNYTLGLCAFVISTQSTFFATLLKETAKEESGVRRVVIDDGGDLLNSGRIEWLASHSGQGVKHPSTWESCAAAFAYLQASHFFDEISVAFVSSESAVWSYLRAKTSIPASDLSTFGKLTNWVLVSSHAQDFMCGAIRLKGDAPPELLQRCADILCERKDETSLVNYLLSAARHKHPARVIALNKRLREDPQYLSSANPKATASLHKAFFEAYLKRIVGVE